MGDEVADVGSFRRLMDEVAVAQGYFQFAEWVARIARLNNLAWTDALNFAHPITGWWYPCRIPNDLGRLTIADVDWMVFQSHTHKVRLHLFSVLP